VALIFAEVISVRVQPLTQMHAADWTGFDAQAAAFALFPVNFNPAPVLFFFSFGWHMVDASNLFSEHERLNWASPVPALQTVAFAGYGQFSAGTIAFVLTRIIWMETGGRGGEKSRNRLRKLTMTLC